MKTANLNSKVFEKDLTENLKIMHYFKIVHLDIKPENIAYSPTFEKWIFLDFGLSEIIPQKIGEMSFVIFKGTYFFSSE